MALIKCSECGKEISDKASACPSCGNPVKSLTTSVRLGKVEIERTNKKWKKRGLLGLAIVFLGLLFLGKSLGLGYFLMFIGFCVVLSSRVGAWWTNG